MLLKGPVKKNGQRMKQSTSGEAYTKGNNVLITRLSFEENHTKQPCNPKIAQIVLMKTNCRYSTQRMYVPAD